MKISTTKKTKIKDSLTTDREELKIKILKVPVGKKGRIKRDFSQKISRSESSL